MTALTLARLREMIDIFIADGVPGDTPVRVEYTPGKSLAETLAFVSVDHGLSSQHIVAVIR